MKRLIYYGYSREEYGQCLPNIQADTLKTDSFLSYGGTAIMLVLFIVSLFFSQLSVFKFVYGFTTLAFAIASAFVFGLRKKPKAAIPLAYVLSAIYYAFGIALALSYPTEKSTIIFLEIVLMPLLFIDVCWRQAIMTSLVGISFTILVIFIKDPSIQFAEVFNAISLSILSLLTNWLVGRGRVRGYVARVRSDQALADLQVVEEELKKESTTDALTKLHNRRSLYAAFAYAGAHPQEAPTGLLMIDLDHFKTINDTYGHLVGDNYLAALGEILLEIEKQGQITAYRYGGEEFVILASGLDDAGLASLSEAIRTKVKQISLASSAQLTVSIGWTSKSSDGKNRIESWLDHADKAVYQAKEAGRDCVIRYSDKPQ